MISSILLAAGMSTRMGKPKPLLDWNGETLIAYQVRQLREAGCGEVIVVLGHGADEIHRRMKGLACRVMLNPTYYVGRSGSLRIGAKAVNRDAEAIVILNVDQPRSAAAIRELIEAQRANAGSVATRPLHGGRHGHPVVVAGSLRPELMSVPDEEPGLRAVLARHPGHVADLVQDDTCLIDMDTPEEYEAALGRLTATA